MKIHKTAGIEGMDALLRKLEQMGKIDRAEIRKIVKGEGDAMIATAKTLAAKESGGLAASIGYVTKNDAKFPTSVLIGPDYKRGGQHAHIIEFGTVERFRGDKQFLKAVRAAKRYGISASTIQRSLEANTALHSTGIGPSLPFMRPAFDRHKRDAEKSITQKVFRLVKTQAKKNKLI